MHHQHFKKLDSTQVFLKENLEELLTHNRNILISASEQTSGIGRKGNTWETLPNSLAMSFTLTPNKTPTLTPIEIGLLATQFIMHKFGVQLLLKWPNDLLTLEGKKCGGILSQYIDSNCVIVGLGINLGKIETPPLNQYSLGIGSVLSSNSYQKIDLEKLNQELYHYVLNNRYETFEQVYADFNKTCIHLNKKVQILEEEINFIGKFKGIGPNGEALVEVNQNLQSFISSSLIILN